MARSIAVVHGTALTPGVSRNGRLYTTEHIRGAVARAQARISEGTATMRSLGHPLAQRTHHAADDDSTAIVGRLTSMTVNDKDGSARYTAELADTPAARTILELIDNSDGRPPFLRGVSIRGSWLGETRRVQHDGRMVETGDDLDIHGLDYTQNPGVLGAGIDTVTRTSAGRKPAETTQPSREITESVQEARVDMPDTTTVTMDVGSVLDDAHIRETVTAVTEKGAAPLKSGKPAAAPTKAPAGSYADPGYQGDRAKRYPLDSLAHARAAWSYINQAKNAKAYTAPQLKRIKGRIKAALRKFGVKISDEGWLIDPTELITEAAAALHEDYSDISGGASYRICMTNGPTTVTVCSYLVDPADLEVVGHAAMAGAIHTIAGLDPDMDGDIDVPGADPEDTDNDMETAPAAPVAEDNTPNDPDPAGVNGQDEEIDDLAVQATDDTEEEPDVSEPTTPPVEPQTPPAAPTTEPAEPATTTEPAAPTGWTLSDTQFASLLAAARGGAPAPALVGAETAPTPATVETTPAPAAPVAETQEQLVARLVAEGIKAALPLAVQEHVQANGVPGRKGLMPRRPVTETDTTTPSADTDLGEFGVPADWPQKPLHQYSDLERRKYVQPAMQDYVLGTRA